MIPRTLLTVIKNNLYKGKVILLLGPRQVGKTTLVSKLQSQINKNALNLNGDDADTRELFKDSNATTLKALIGNKELIIIDEAQRIENIGVTLKILVDNFPDQQVIATGSSSFELRDKVNEPLTGRKYEYKLFPLSFNELCQYSSLIEETRQLEHRLIYGYYPEVTTKPDEARDLLALLTDSYLYKDILGYKKIKKPEKIEKLLQALALQLGSEVSYNEIGQMVGADNETVENYINILEKAFVIFRLKTLCRNKRNEIKKSRKIYFYDNGIRNAIINNFNPISLRQDIGGLWENFLINERLKRNNYNKIYNNYYFWRTHSKTEIDFIEERDGKFFAFEFKWNTKHKKIRAFNTFSTSYPNTTFEIITPENFHNFIM